METFDDYPEDIWVSYIESKDWYLVHLGTLDTEDWKECKKYLDQAYPGLMEFRDYRSTFEGVKSIYIVSGRNKSLWTLDGNKVYFDYIQKLYGE